MLLSPLTAFQTLTEPFLEYLEGISGLYPFNGYYLGIIIQTVRVPSSWRNCYSVLEVPLVVSFLLEKFPGGSDVCADSRKISSKYPSEGLGGRLERIVGRWQRAPPGIKTTHAKTQRGETI